MKSTSIKDIAHTLGKTVESMHSITGFAVDTRLLGRGNLFFALPGAKVDGHSFLSVAAAGGASGAVVQEDYSGPDYGLPLIRVADVLASLQKLATEKIRKSHSRVIAVTGSLGKTTTKDFISILLKHRFKVAVSPGNNNSQIGLPLTIMNHVEPDDEVLVLEMGMTQPGQIAKLVQIAPPELAVVTTVALVHACSFDSLEDIGKAKAEIFSHPATKVGIYDADSDFNHVLSRSGHCSKISFSTTSRDAGYFLHAAEKHMEIYEKHKTPKTLPILPVPGRHNQHNFLAAVAVARQFGLTWEEIESSITTLELPEKRLQFIEKFGALFINDAYNASEMSIKAALDSLPEPKAGGKRIAVLGEIVELGKFSEGCHRAVGEYALDKVDSMLCYGKGCLPIMESWKAAGRPVVWGEERAEIVNALRERLQPGDVVLLKGSRSKAVCKVLDEL